jgi:photosystem II stability/assembly factor-like uncharacterized protein
MDVSKADPDVIYGVYGALQVSRNGGRSWAIVGREPEVAMDFAASAMNVDTLYAATRNGIVRSTDGGRSWSPAHRPLGPATMVDVADDGNLYAFQVGSGLIKASESDLKWKFLSNGFGQAVVLHIAVDPSNGQKMYAVTFNPRTRANAIVASRDGGTTWTKLGAEGDGK